MISSPCSAEQAQRIKLCPRKSPPQSFPQSHSKPPDISSGGFAVVGRHSPPPKPRGQGPPRMRSIQKALGQPSGGALRFIQNPPRSRSRTAAGELEGARPASNEIHTESPRTAVRGLPLRFIQNPPRRRSRTAAGELEGARPASNEIHTESPRTFRPGAFCILFFSCCAFSARSPASAAGSGSRRSWR